MQCGTQFAETAEPPLHCPICEDERQFIRHAGQEWATLKRLAHNHHNRLEHESRRKDGALSSRISRRARWNALSSRRWQRNQLLCAKKHRVEDNAIHLLPADLLACVLFLKPSHQWFEVFHHRASGNVFAGRFLQDFAPIFEGAFFQDVIKHRRCRRLKLCDFAKKSLDAVLPTSQDKLSRKYKGGT